MDPMNEYPAFGVLLGRVAERQGLGLPELSERAGLSERELKSVLDGAVPGSLFLERLAPALDLHAADLFAVAQVTLPAESAGRHEQYAPGPGAVLMRMLAHRGLNWTSSAKALSRLGGVHLAASSIGALGHGRKELTADLVPPFASVLGIRADVLAVLLAV